MLRSSLTLMLVLASLLVASVGNASEMTIQQYEQTLRDQAKEDGRAYAEILAALKDKDLSAWDELDTGRYLTECLGVVYSALIVYRHENQMLPLSPSDLKGSPFLDQWPLNPFNNWEPVKVLGPNDPFSAGDITYQICSPEFFSYIGSNGDIRAMGLEMGIYGPDRDFARTGKPERRAQNTWAVVPEGTYLMLGAYRETVEETARKLEKRRQKAKEKQTAADKQEQSGRKEGDSNVKGS